MDVVDTELSWMRALYRGSGNATGMERETLELMMNTLGHGGFPDGPIKDSRLGKESLIVPSPSAAAIFSSPTRTSENTMSDVYVFNY